MNASTRKNLLASLLLSALCAAAPAWGARPEGAGHDNGNGNGRGKSAQGAGERGERQDSRQDDRRGGTGPAAAKPARADARTTHFFEDRQRVVARSYFDDSYRSGRCPPGLAKKNNGCMPPGQARQWQRGQPLGSNVYYYSLPQAVLISLGPPPSGHRYVRVAAEILLIAIGTGLVVDAIERMGSY